MLPPLAQHLTAAQLVTMQSQTHAVRLLAAGMPGFLPAVAPKTLTSAVAYTKAEIETACCRQVSAQVPTSFCLSPLPRSPVNTRRSHA